MEELRDQRGFPWLEQTLGDVRFAVRGLLRRPGFTAVAVLSLAFGIGANVTVFSWFRAVYLDPMPGVVDARSLVTINAARRQGSGYSNSYADLEFIRDHSKLYHQMFAHELENLPLSDGRLTEMTMGSIVSGNYFDTLGLKMTLGRGFRPDEDQVLDRNPVMVISHGLWQRRFGGRPSILGEKLMLNGAPLEVIGVAPPGFVGVYGGIRSDFWFPLHMNRVVAKSPTDQLRRGAWLQIMARPKPGVTLAQLQAELDVFSKQILAAHRKTDSYYRAVVFPLHQANRGFHSSIFQLVKILGLAVGLILLLACLNVANLLVARAMDRSREMNVRLSLGAGRGRLIRQLLTECLVLSLMGGVVAAVFAVWFRNLVNRSMSFGEAELVLNQPVDWMMFGFLFAVAAATALLFGLLPALEATKVNLADGLKEGAVSTTASHRRAFLRGALVSAEVALSAAALIGAVQASQFLSSLYNADRGFRSDNLVTARTHLDAAGLNEARRGQFYRATVEQLVARGEVESAAWTTYLPMNGSGGGNSRPVEVQGFVPADGKPLSITADFVSPGYLRTMGIPLAAGREFEWNEAAPPVLVNQAFVDQYLKGRDPVGASVKVGPTWRTVTGVYRNYVYRHPFWAKAPEIFLPLTNESSAVAVVRAKNDTSAATLALREAIREFDRGLPVTSMMTMNESIGVFFTSSRVVAGALALFSGVALLLAGVGLYGVLAAFVNQRRRELGIRTALGATPGQLRRMVGWQTLRLTVAGLAVGAGLGYLLTRAMVSEFLGMKSAGLGVFAAGFIGFALLALAAAAIPARRVSRLDPLAALRYE
jgi:predicted permease